MMMWVFGLMTGFGVGVFVGRNAKRWLGADHWLFRPLFAKR